MPIEKTKLNTLNKLIDHGINTEKKITALGLQEILTVPKITVPEIHIITELQDAIKSKAIIAYLASAEVEPDAVLEKSADTANQPKKKEDDKTIPSVDDEKENLKHDGFYL